MINKAKLFRKVSAKIFGNCGVYKYLNTDGLFKGFFFLFIYKNFILSEVVQSIKEQLPNEY